MPAFTFEKISPPVRRGPAAAAEKKKQRSRIVQFLDRFTEVRTKRALRKDGPEVADPERPSE
jgi:hypothetical protein